MQKELIGKVVKVYRNVRTKYRYEGDCRIEHIHRLISDNLYLVDVSLEDDFFTTIVDLNDILY